MEQKKIDRISQLSRLSRERELTEEEKQEQQLLRREYVDSMKQSACDPAKCGDSAPRRQQDQAEKITTHR